MPQDELLDPLDQRLAVARAAAEQITAWQARLVDAVESLMEIPCADPWSSYLTWALDLSTSEAREIVELVDRLGELPRTREVMATGERSLRTVLSIARRSTPETEERVLTDTEALTGAQLDRTLREYAKVTAPSQRTNEDPEEDEAERDPDPSSAQWGWRDGRFRGGFDLDGADGAALHAHLEAERGRVREEQIEGEHTYVEPYRRTCAEALVALAERAASTSGNDVGFMPETITTNLIVHAHESSDGELRVERSFLPGVGAVPTWSLDMLAERGPVITTIMLNGEPIMATEPVRLATKAQKRALLARDGGCAYPGCGLTRHLIAHHIRYFDDDGPTELRNMVLVCRRHHRVVHRHALSIVPDPESPPDRFRWQFRTSRGDPLHAPSPGPVPCRLPGTRRRTGSGDPLTLWAIDTFVHKWVTEDERTSAA